MSKPLLIISGPTATGKTSLALKIAKKYPSTIISADSRQVYKGLNIGTGKDHPKDKKIYLIDLINPRQTFSAAHFRRLALKIIKKSHQQKKLPIVVGGTGHYIDSLVAPKNTFHIKPRPILRKLLNKMPILFLQNTLKILDFNTFDSLNRSDRYNPHRLIRKIEISLSANKTSDSKPVAFNYFHLSLTASNKLLYKRIDKRVQQRLDQGLLKEIQFLLRKYSWTDPGLNTLAYKEFKPYFTNNKPLKDCIQKWKYDEHAYARRQKTWFKKQEAIFLDINHLHFPQNALKKINIWYNQL